MTKLFTNCNINRLLFDMLMTLLTLLMFHFHIDLLVYIYNIFLIILLLMLSNKDFREQTYNIHKHVSPFESAVYYLCDLIILLGAINHGYITTAFILILTGVIFSIVNNEVFKQKE